MSEIVYAIIGACCIGWILLKFIYYLDHRQAVKLTRKREKRLIAEGKTMAQSEEELGIRRFEHKCDVEWEAKLGH